MEDIHQIFTRFKEEFPEIYNRDEALGKEIHEKAGPLGETSRWLIKIAISAACNHKRALATHIKRAQAAGAVSYTHLTLPTRSCQCRYRWSPDH